MLEAFGHEDCFLRPWETTLQILLEHRPLLEILATGSLCGWVVSLAFGLGLIAPDRAAALGIPGILIGGLLFDPPVPGFDTWTSVVALLPSLAGTTVVLFAAELFRRVSDEAEARRRERMIEERTASRSFKAWPAR